MPKKVKKVNPFSAHAPSAEAPSAAQTHFPSPIVESSKWTDEEKIEKIAEHFKGILEVLGLDLSNDSLARTPFRIARMYVQEVFSGLDEKNFPNISFFDDDFYFDEKSHKVFTKVGFTSFCEHHFVPMTGYAYVAYLPKKKLIGLSKIPRIVRFFAQRPQLQERLTAQIADSLAILLETDNVAVSISAKHYCVMARGIQDQHSHTTTNVLRGEFDTNTELRREFFEDITRPDYN